jgi:hypothetical protein
MPMRNRTFVAAATLLPLFLASCETTSRSEPSQGVARVDDLLGYVERVHTESELAKQRVQTAYSLMSAVVNRTYKTDAQTAFQEFSRSIDEAEAQSERLRTLVRSTRTAAQKVFEQWNTDLMQIQNPQMRMRSEARLDTTYKRYQTLLAAMRSAEAGYDQLQKQLRDLTLFLGHDLNPASIAEVRDDARAIGDLAEDVDGRFHRSLAAARDYLSSARIANAQDASPTQQTPSAPR